ncbi:SHOCT domain-containing protein [Natronorubrum sp. DTA7]|uniref:SHOCT domain-containing protein n=1 Tax=Natronorubrum sp. DTA7 TaxID=3447016 RepID=UPI003F87C844
MTESRPLVRGLTPSVAVVIVAVLATFVALMVINSSVAIILAFVGLLFGGDLLRELAEAVDGELSDAEFERRLAGLLETETVADVERYLEEGTATPSAQEAETEADRELERSSGS